MEKTLLQVFRQDNDAWNALYRSLYDSPLSRHLDINIRQMDASKESPAFFYYTEDLVLTLSHIRTGTLRLHRLIKKIPGVAIKQFTRASLIEEIQASNEIEGVRSTKKEIARAMDVQEADAGKKIRLWSVVNKYEKLQKAENIPFRTSRDLREFYNGFVLDEVLRANPRNAPDGEIFRREGVDVQGNTKILHKGLSPEKKIIAAMDQALSILQNESIPDLVRISVFHYLFGYIHPFYDGNGRTSRFIASYYLSRILHPLIALRLSLTIKRSQRTYYQLFDRTNAFGSRGDLTPFISGFLLLIKKSIDRVSDLLYEKGATLSRLAEKLSSVQSDDKIDKKIYFILLQAALFSDDGVTLNEISIITGNDIRTIRNHIKNYPAGHIMVNKLHRAHRYKLDTKIFD